MLIGSTTEAIGFFVGGLLTLAIFSFLYKDNPIYKFAEHIFVGVSAGYWFVRMWNDAIMPYIIEPIMEGNFWPLIPGIIGILMLLRAFPSTVFTKFSRLGIGFSVGVMAGYNVITRLDTNILKQIAATLRPFKELNFSSGSIAASLNAILILLVVFAALIYFFFSVEHKGTIGHVAKFGMYMLMVTFGASFGYTVMGRISLLIGRILYLTNQWMESIKYLTGI